MRLPRTVVRPSAGPVHVQAAQCSNNGAGSDRSVSKHIGPMVGQFLAAVPARRHGRDAGADGAAQRTSSGVSPTTQMRLGVGGSVQDALHFGQRLAGHVVAVEVMVAVAADGEVLVQAEMPQLDAGAGADVAGQQTDQHVLARAQLDQQIRHAGQHAAVVSLQACGKAAQVSRRQPAQVVRRLVDDVHAEEVADDGPVGAAAELQLFDDAGDAKLIGQRRFQGDLARAAAGNERAVDVEQTNVHANPSVLRA